jgi:hypothetical protein
VSKKYRSLQCKREPGGAGWPWGPFNLGTYNVRSNIGFAPEDNKLTKRKKKKKKYRKLLAV